LKQSNERIGESILLINNPVRNVIPALCLRSAREDKPR